MRGILTSLQPDLNLRFDTMYLLHFLLTHMSVKSINGHGQLCGLLTSNIGRLSCPMCHLSRAMIMSSSTWQAVQMIDGRNAQVPDDPPVHAPPALTVKLPAASRSQPNAPGRRQLDSDPGGTASDGGFLRQGVSGVAGLQLRLLDRLGDYQKRSISSTKKYLQVDINRTQTEPVIVGGTRGKGEEPAGGWRH